MTTDNVLITLELLSELEDSVIDCLLTFNSELEFAHMQVGVNERGHHGWAILEQVGGMRRKVRLQFMVAHSAAGPLLAELGNRFSGSRLRYWVTPVLQHGML